MKKIVYIFVLSVFFANLQAQFKVGTNVKNINPNAMFQVDAANKGILIPRLQLVQSTNFAPLSAHVQGMIAYNTATSNDVVPGFYYNDGVKWNLIGNATGLAKVEDILSLNNNAFRYINVNGDTVVITKVFQNVLSYDSVSKSLITNVNGVLDTVLLNVQKFDTTHVYAKIKSDSTQFAQKVDSVYVNTKGDSVFVKDGYGATTGFKLAQFDTTHVYAKIKADSSQFAQKVDSVYVNAVGDSVFVKDGYGATIGYKLASPLVKNGLNKNGDTVKLGGSLTENTTITTAGKSLTVATAGDTVRFTGLLEGKKTDSILVLDSLNRALRRISVNALNRKNVVTTAATSYTVGETEDVVIFNGTAQTTFTLPAASSNSGRIITIMNMAKSNDNVNIVLSVPVILEGITGGDFSLDKIASQSSTWTYPEGLGSNHQNSISIISNGTSWYRFGI